MKQISKEQYEEDMGLIFDALYKIIDKLKIKPDKDRKIYIKAKRE